MVEDALSRRPTINHISVAYHEELSALKDLYARDDYFSSPYQALLQGESLSDFTMAEGYLFFKGKLCICKELKEKVLGESHNPPFIGHRGISSTIEILERFFYWPTLRQDAKNYVVNCLICQKVKADRNKPSRLLLSLLVRESPWLHITMDFLSGIPRTIHGHDTIWTVVDRFSKQAHFIPCKKNLGAPEAAHLFIKHIFALHGMPRSIVSDRDSRFTSNFWQALFENLGTSLRFSSAYDPQTDGQSEITNRTILDLLTSYVSHQKTVEKVPAYC